MGKLVWSARRNYCWTARAEDGTYIEVREDIYQQQLEAFFEAKGMKLRSHYSLMQEAEAIFERQRVVVEELEQDLDFWRSLPFPGVLLTPRRLHR